MTNPTRMTNAAIVDELGRIAAQKQDIAAREKVLKAQLDKRTGQPSNFLWTGELFEVRKSTSIRSILDTKALREMFRATGAYLPEKTAASSRWAVTARVAEPAAA